MSIWRLAAVLACAGGCQFSSRMTLDPDPDGAAAGDEQPAGTWLEPWTHRKPITLRAAQVEAPGAALAEFPVMLAVADPEIMARARSDGADLAFTAADGTTVLASDLERYGDAAFTAWVKIPSLSATTDTTIYAYYGNPSPPQPTPELVWTASFHAVYHLSQDPGPGTAGDMRDATAGHHDGTAEASMSPTNRVVTPFGLGLLLDGSNHFVGVGALDVGPLFTISLWMNVSTDSSIQTLLANSGNGSTTNGYRFFVNSSGTSDRSARFETGNGASTDSALTPNNVVMANQWHHMAVTVDRAMGRAQIYVDGVLANPADLTIRNDFTTDSDFEIGRMENATNEFGGLLDQVEIASELRSVEWLRTAERNQRTPASFHEVGPEQPRP